MQNLKKLVKVTKNVEFNLVPQGKTLEFIEKNGVLECDENIHNMLPKMKEFINNFYKKSINDTLVSCSNDPLFKDNGFWERYMALFANHSGENDNKEYKQKQEIIRKVICSYFPKDYNPKEIVNKAKELASEEEKSIFEMFDNKTTLFDTFINNRKNLFSTERKHSSVLYRIIDENIPFFIKNAQLWEKFSNEGIFDEITNEYYSKVLSINKIGDYLTQGGIDTYNSIIGGMIDEEFGVVEGLNSKINHYNQDNKTRLPLFKQMYKMILSDRETSSLMFEKFESDAEMVNTINSFYEAFKENSASINNIITEFNEYDKERIFVNTKYLSDISKEMFGEWNFIETRIKEYLDAITPTTGKENRNPEKRREKIDKLFKGTNEFSVSIIEKCTKYENLIQDYLIKTNSLENVKDGYRNCEMLLTIEGAKISHSDEKTKKIQDFLDSIKKSNASIKIFNTISNDVDIDENFDNVCSALWENISTFDKIYDKCRNWLTRKPGDSREKVPLYFGTSTFLKGWDKNKEKQNLGVILKKGKKYYLAILNSKYKNVFDCDMSCEGECYEKMEYKQIALPMGFGGFVRKCSGTAYKYGWVCPEDCTDAEGKIIIKDEEAQPVLSKLIDCYKDFLNKYEKDGFRYSQYEFIFKDSTEYNKLSAFFDDVAKQSYKIFWKNFPTNYIDELVEEGKLYLFQIWNKDFSEYSKGTPSLYTKYLEALFVEENDGNVRLNGEGKLSYVKKTINKEDLTIHKAHTILPNKGMGNKATSEFDYDIIKDRRFSMDQFKINMTITFNAKAEEKCNMNRKVDELIQKGTIEHIIGIDRGERNLMYATVIDLNGNIVEQKSFNVINGIDYHQKLMEKSKSRDNARKGWGNIGCITNLKSGYLSYVIHEIAEMIIKYKAIVSFEKLNQGFKYSRKHIEISMYDKFEKELLSKLQFYVNNKKDINGDGGVLNAYQFVSDNNNEYNRNGMVFFVPAEYTSAIDPTTGFANMLRYKYENIQRAQEFFSTFDDISYDSSNGYFKFTFDYSKFRAFNAKCNGQCKWTACTYGERINNVKDNKYGYKSVEVNLTEEFKKVFEECKIPLDGELQNSIVSINNAEHLKKLIELLRLTLQVRNSKVNDGNVDYIISPILNENGEFFDSRKQYPHLPIDADANGAYNIARKALIIVNKIKSEANDNNVTREEWFRFAQ